MSDETPLGRRAWLLAALSSAKGGLTAVQLQKSLFLLGERRKAEVGGDFYQFTPYSYGPFCRDIYDDADDFIAQGIVELDVSGGRSLREYRLTATGSDVAKKESGKLPVGGVEYLQQVIQWAQSLPFNDLIRAIYTAYPAMRANSVFQD